MNECKIERVCEGQCSECGKDRKGVRFSIPSAGDAAFLCWEHFRLPQASPRPHASVRESVVRTESDRRCCRCRCCGCGEPHRYRHGEPIWRNGTETVCVSESVTEGRSRGESAGGGETHTEGRSTGRTWSHGRSHREGETR